MVIKPFLRWAGGKRWLASSLSPILASRLSGTYFEVFLGGGALFFSIEPKRAVLSDINSDLICAYKVTSSRPNQLLELIRQMPVDGEAYYEIRSSNPKGSLERAARFIYLNRTCYGGLHRTNKMGEFNVPYGGGSRTTAPLWEIDLLRNASRALRGLSHPKEDRSIEILGSDFETCLDRAAGGDVVFCDPTYACKSRKHFDRYTDKVFTWNDQKRLAISSNKAFRRGALVVISNLFSSELRPLYPGAIWIPVSRKKAMGNECQTNPQGKEYLIILDPKPESKCWMALKKKLSQA